MRWIIGAAPLQALAQSNQALARHYFDNVGSFVIGSPPNSSWSTTWLKMYRSYSSYANDLSGTPHWVAYDNEKWTDTPVIEQLHPTALMSTFMSLAHARGQQCIMTPARDLMTVAGADCIADVQHGETIDAAYLRCSIPASAAGSDIFSCQSQADQGDTPTYLALVQGAHAQTSASGQPLFAGLTTLRGDPVSAMVACYHAVETIVDGFWLNVSVQTVNIAADFLTQIKS
jgi:hypothetical protein